MEKAPLLCPPVHPPLGRRRTLGGAPLGSSSLSGWTVPPRRRRPCPCSVRRRSCRRCSRRRDGGRHAHDHRRPCESLCGGACYCCCCSCSCSDPACRCCCFFHHRPHPRGGPCCCSLPGFCGRRRRRRAPLLLCSRILLPRHARGACSRRGACCRLGRALSSCFCAACLGRAPPVDVARPGSSSPGCGPSADYIQKVGAQNNRKRKQQQSYPLSVCLLRHAKRGRRCVA